MVTLDTNVLVRAFQEQEPDHLQVVTSINRTRKLSYDYGNSISGEYERNVGRLLGYIKWCKRLHRLQAIYRCHGGLPEKHRTKLTSLGCHETSDHVFIGVAFHSGRVLVSEDSDVGKGPNGLDSPHCDALKYLLDEMQLNVYDAQEFCAVLETGD